MSVSPQSANEDLVSLPTYCMSDQLEIQDLLVEIPANLSNSNVFQEEIFSVKQSDDGIG